MKLLRFVVFACLLTSLQLFAQTQITTGVIQGSVVDPSGAVVAGASVEARNPDTNFTRTLTTDNNGRFVFLELPSTSPWTRCRSSRWWPAGLRRNSAVPPAAWST